jgi:phosphoglycolate phosphatase-like HAD superfamily hydrolase
VTAGLLRALILDFDGVILESNNLKTAAFEHVFARFPEHAAAMMAWHHAHVSESRFVKFTHLVTERLGRPAGDPLIAELGDLFSAEMQRQIASCPLVPGADEFLRTVHGRLPVFLASVTPQGELNAILDARGLARFFTGVYGCPPWTKPGAVAEIVSALDSPEGVLLIGDSAGDQRAAAGNGVEFLGRDSGLPFDDPRPPTFPDMIAMTRAVAPRLPPSREHL